MSPAAALLWAMTFSTERSLQAAVGGRLEAQVGVVPDTSFDDSEASVAFAVVPVAGIQVQSDRTELTALYRPRAYWRFPNPISLERPLILHQANLDHVYQVSPRTSWRNRFAGSIGEVDYSLSSLVFDPSQPSVPSTDVTELVRVGGSTALGHQLTSRTTAGVALEGSYNSPLDTSDEAFFVRSFDAEIAPFWGYAITRRDDVTLGVPVGYAWFDEEATYLIATPNLLFGHDFTRLTSGGLGVGLAYLRVLDSLDPAGPEVGETDVTPTGDARLESRVYGERGKYVDVGAVAQYRWYFDPVLGRPAQRAGGGVFGGMTLPPKWTVGVAVSFYTTVRESVFESAEEEELVRRDQTMLRIDAPVSYDINRFLGLEFGVRSNLRGPALSEGLDLSDVELWFYGALRVVFDPKDKQAGWMR